MQNDRFVEVSLDEEEGIVIAKLKFHGIEPAQSMHVAAKVASLYNGIWMKRNIPLYPFEPVVLWEAGQIGGILNEIFTEVL